MKHPRKGYARPTVTFSREECSQGLHADVSMCGEAEGQLPGEPICEPVERSYEVTGTVSPYVPAYISGPPESCYPAEGGEVEIETVKLDGKEVPGWETAFTGTDFEEMEELLAEAAAEDAEEDFDDREPDDVPDWWEERGD